MSYVLVLVLALPYPIHKTGIKRPRQQLKLATNRMGILCLQKLLQMKDCLAWVKDTPATWHFVSSTEQVEARAGSAR